MNEQHNSHLQSFQIYPNKRKYLICYQQCAADHVMPLLTALQQHNLPFSSHFLEDEISGSDDEWLQEFSRQKMGTQLCLAGRDETVARLRKLADQSGFREEEIQTYSVGRRKITLFCAACQHLTETMQCEQASCGFCGRLLNVTPHYSRRLDAYLGYIGLS